jgi:hypothetical protein
MNGNYMSQSQMQQHHHHHHHHHHGGSPVIQHQHQQQPQQHVGSPVNPRAAKLVADYKQIILELRKFNLNLIFHEKKPKGRQKIDG